MSEKNIKPIKPAPTKPSPSKPTPVKPGSVKPIRAHTYNHKHCIRCDKAITESSGVVRKLCSPCDLELQAMHWQIEYSLFRKVTYMPEASNEELSAEWFKNNGYADALVKLPPPKERNFFKRHEPLSM